ncbi:hypothetical protein D3C81_2081030 [compost metagenome]
MLFAFKNIAVINTDAFENAISIEEPVIKNGYLCIFLRYVLSIQIDPLLSHELTAPPLSLPHRCMWDTSPESVPDSLRL